MKGRELEQIIREKIVQSEQGFITFAEYMEQSLYHPELGYYMKPTVKIGKQGDFYTSSSVHSVFAETFVDLSVQVSKASNVPLTFLEVGAGTGLFATQFLQTLQTKHPLVYKDSTYYIFDRSEQHIRQQKEQLDVHGERVRWISIEDEWEGYEGIILTNELFDAFPVHLIKKINGGIKEIAVTWSEKQQQLIEQLIDPKKSVTDYLRDNHLSINEGQVMEIPVAVSQWLHNFSKKIQSALWFVVDYGYTDEEIALPQYREGSLLCYYQHQVDDRPLEQPGHKDITYHIHFDSITREAIKGGWNKQGLFPQHQFLLQAGILQYLANHTGGDPFQHKGIAKNRAIRHLISPESISGSFRVLILSKGKYEQQEKAYDFLKPVTFI
ncbi:class I SAM-dependent methyltransferase [Bacillus horti]|uniref:SAM-dependent MidA family methyltransferase n=1 Tax=Caldalkalibacillus horti TaxID=77523 RepID=A0ABT9W249_9BACI|nr:SAM-dependent methyltransferase [Bacillus horti]MDQ0166920.1 SAM-dependent MidA family methyltransferase [Bacillus horti]